MVDYYPSLILSELRIMSKTFISDNKDKFGVVMGSLMLWNYLMLVVILRIDYVIFFFY